MKQGLANYGLWAKCGPSPGFVNKVLLKCSHTHLLTCCPWQLSYSSGTTEEVEQEMYGLQSLKYFLSGPSQKKFAKAG